MFPLKQRQLIRGCQAHVNAGLGCAADYVASIGTPVYAPFDGKIEIYSGTQGGKWIRLIRSNGDRIEMAHLSSYTVIGGSVLEGTLIAYTGNTGAITTGPHKHIQILDKSGHRIDPESYIWDNEKMELKDFIVDGMPADERIAALKDQVKRLQEQSRNLTEALTVSRSKESQYYNSWQDEIDKRKAAESNYQLCLTGESSKLQAIWDILKS